MVTAISRFKLRNKQTLISEKLSFGMALLEPVEGYRDLNVAVAEFFYARS